MVICQLNVSYHSINYKLNIVCWNTNNEHDTRFTAVKCGKDNRKLHSFELEMEHLLCVCDSMDAILIRNLNSFMTKYRNSRKNWEYHR